MDLAEIIRGIKEHNAANPKHQPGCNCMDIYAVAIVKVINEQDRATKRQLRAVLKLALQWDEFRNPISRPQSNEPIEYEAE
jgi:hypothetical protein